MQPPRLKVILATPLALLLTFTDRASEFARRLYAYAALRAAVVYPVPPTVVILGRAEIFGTRRVRCGEHLLLYPGLHLETQGEAEIVIGDGVVLSRGVHLVAMSGVRIGSGTMIGEYTSVRDANHTRSLGTPLRDAGHQARPIQIGAEVWIGRGVTILAGVTIGDRATVGANAVVTCDVEPGATVAGVPARAILPRSRETPHPPA